MKPAMFRREKPRTLASADQIISEIKRRARFTNGYELTCGSCNCTPTPLGTQDEDGCNWQVTTFSNCTPSCELLMAEVVGAVRRGYTLLPDRG
jgi:hypothetical protein